MSIRAPLSRAGEYLDGQSRRERLLLAGAVAIVLLLAWDTALRGPAAAHHATALERIDRTRADIERLQASGARLSAQLDANGQDDQALAAIERRLQRLDARLAARTRRIVEPKAMVRVLRDVLADDERLRLIALHNTGAEPVDVSAADAAALPTIYRHRVELVVEGRYFALLAYLRRLEGLDWRFHWDGLQLETTEYPTARARLSLSTLSLAQEWIGV